MILAKYYKIIHPRNLIPVKSQMDGWQKVDNNDISDFSFLFSLYMIKRNNTSCKKFNKAKGYDKTCFETFQVIFMFCIREIQSAQNVVRLTAYET